VRRCDIFTPISSPTAVIESAHSEHLTNLPFADARDFEDADRGFIGALEPCVVKAADGRVVWDNDIYAFVDGDAPTSVHPSLWRQSKLCAKQGLYEVIEGIYQVRGLDLSNISFIEGDTGVIVIDPLISTETAAAALNLYRAHRGDRPVVAVIYTHSHVDHFGGVLGVIWIQLNKKGIGLHGTSDPDAIGRTASHGCVRLRNEDIEKLYDMVPVGTVVYIY